LKELDTYLAAKQALHAAHGTIADALGIDRRYFDGVRDSRHESWGPYEFINARGEPMDCVALAPDAQTLLDGVKISRAPASLRGEREYPEGFFICFPVYDETDRQPARSTEWAGFRFENYDSDEETVLVIVRADREVKIPSL